MLSPSGKTRSCVNIMSIVSDRPDSLRRSGARAFARLDTREPNKVVTAAGQSGPVTLDKIGLFLELDLGRLFHWVRAGLLLAVVLAAVGAVAGGAYGILAKPLFTVSSDILINPAKLQVVPNDLY